MSRPAATPHGSPAVPQPLAPRFLFPSLGLLGLLFAASCSSGPARKAVFSVEGKVFHKSEKTPAAGALVIFRPAGTVNDGDWPEGFPRATAGDDGAFKLTTYDDGDGAPAGEYAVLVQWPKRVASETASQDERGEDRFAGAYSNPDNPPFRKQVKAGPNDPKDFILILR